MARTLSAPGPRPGPQIQDLKALGELVRSRRLELSLRIDDAAHACGVASNVFSRLENGGPVGVDRLLRVLSGLGLTLLVTTKEEAIRLQPALPMVHGGRTSEASRGDKETDV
ncbi:helix-turn-helix domain-containing protein [Burkholderia sp. Bp8998]|uniref:helix-turn-helix domain-containing protein n=1 Tax=Burkholderia sp. Bp8998 TaxID=2184557 RepID=UPI000F5A9B7E|nr:helix-turn-helix transcriptional regulator [Burkholderia sp. Bp8998]RQS09143.1 transcriptional regulator [Burkholderia sp. Bp8998]